MVAPVAWSYFLRHRVALSRLAAPGFLSPPGYVGFRCSIQPVGRVELRHGLEIGLAGNFIRLGYRMGGLGAHIPTRISPGILGRNSWRRMVRSRRLPTAKTSDVASAPATSNRRRRTAYKAWRTSGK
jgi:hypothetical protein